MIFRRTVLLNTLQHPSTVIYVKYDGQYLNATIATISDHILERDMAYFKYHLTNVKQMTQMN